MDISKTKLNDLGTMSGIGPQPEAFAELPAGKLLSDRYEIVRVIGRGGMGVVYEANDRLRGGAVALKFLRPDLVSSDTATQRFLNEARVASDLAHESIVRVYDVGRHEDSYFLSMELLRGKSLRQVIQETAASGHQMPVAQALAIARDTAAALAYAHRTTIHRDIKPENIWILPDGRAKLMDFGIARLQNQTQGLTKTATAMGTAYYMAPEQLVGSGQIDHRADQYALGVVLYEMLTGSLPIGRGGAASSLRPGLSTRLDLLVDRMLAGAAAKRFPGDAELLAALSAPRLGDEKRGWLGKKAMVALACTAGLLVAAYGAWTMGWLDMGRLSRSSAPAAAQVQELSQGRFILRGDEVHDPRSKLTWQRCSVGQRWSGDSCTGSVKRQGFESAQRETGGKWRVPTIEELDSLTTPGNPAVDTTAFPQTASLGYWSSTSTADGRVKTVSMSSGMIATIGRADQLAVRLVRSER